MTVQPRLASTVMLVRDIAAAQDAQEGIEVFMVRRAVQSEFMPDLYVFPGGSVTADDQDAELAEGVCVPVAEQEADPEKRTALGSGVRAAAMRDLFEEANVLLAYYANEILAVGEEAVERFAAYRRNFNERRGSLVALAHSENLTFATDRLAYFAHWITPEEMPKRYDTHFFLATAPTSQEALYDHMETSEGIWIRPAVALARFEQRTFPIAFPTFHQLRDLSTFSSVQEALSAAATRYVQTHMPILTQAEGGRQVHLPEDPEHTWRV